MGVLENKEESVLSCRNRQVSVEEGSRRKPQQVEGANIGPGVLGDLHKGEDPPRVPQRPRMPGGSKLNRGGMSAKESDE